MKRSRLFTAGLAGLVAVSTAWRVTGAASESSLEAVNRLAGEVRRLGWLLYGARSPHGDWDLFRCRPDGSEVHALTRTPEFNESSPQVSRDGRRLLYRRVKREEQFDNNRHGEQGALLVANSDGAYPQALGAEGELPWASWSPDGTRIASLSSKGIRFIDVATRQVGRTLERKGFFQQMTWSPDGQWLIGVANSYGTGWSIARMNAATGAAGAVNRVDCCTPDWFPDSKDVICSWRPPGQKANKGYGWTQLWMADAEGKSRRLVYGEDGRHVYGGHVSPDGKYVLFTGNLQEDGDPGNAGAPMALMRLSDAPIIGGESTELRALHPNSKDGPVLTLPTGWEPCWTFSELPGAAPSAPAILKLTTAPGGAPAVAESAGEVARLRSELHDRGWLVFSAKTDAGDWDLFRARPDGSDRRNLTDTREFNEAGARFSPDGTRLLFYRMPKSEPVDNNSYGTFELVIARADGSESAIFGNGFPWASWSPDGKQLACLNPKGIQVIDLATRQVIRQFPRHGIVSQLVWSPDGRWFIGTANGLGPFWNIACLDPGTGEIKPVSETERYNCTPDWTADSRSIVYARGIIPQQPGHAELWVAAVDGADRRRIYAEADHHIYGASASPDGKYLLFTRSRDDLGKVAQIEMAIIRRPGPAHLGDTNSIVRLDLGPGWEPHWTAKEIMR